MSSRPLSHLQLAGSRYPGAWKHVEMFRQARGVDLPAWPEWCFMPVSAWHAIVSQGKPLPPHLIGDVARLAALGTWRYSKGVYRIDLDVFTQLTKTPVIREIPSDVLLRLPEWCVYIETPGLSWFGTALHGFFVHLESDINDGRKELRFLLDCDSGLAGIPIHIGPWTLIESVDRMAAEADKFRQPGTPALSGTDNVPDIASQIQPLLSLTLYLCCDEPDIQDRTNPGSKPGRPTPTKTKRGLRWFEAPHVRLWSAGATTGEALRQATAISEDTGRKVSPHLRRAHWHGFWRGPIDGERKFFVKWLPPTLVASR